MRPGALALAVCALAVLGAGPPAPAPPLPARMADTGGGTQLITAVAPDRASTTGTVTWWDREDGRWVRRGSAAARFGARGLAAGTSRRQGTNTTPTGLYGLPYAFGIKAAPTPGGARTTAPAPTTAGPSRARPTAGPPSPST